MDPWPRYQTQFQSQLKTQHSEEFIIEELLSLLPEIKCFNKRGKINEVRTANMIAKHQSQLIKYVFSPILSFISFEYTQLKSIEIMGEEIL